MTSPAMNITDISAIDGVCVSALSDAGIYAFYTACVSIHEQASILNDSATITTVTKCTEKVYRIVDELMKRYCITASVADKIRMLELLRHAQYWFGHDSAGLFVDRQLASDCLRASLTPALRLILAVIGNNNEVTIKKLAGIVCRQTLGVVEIRALLLASTNWPEAEIDLGPAEEALAGLCTDAIASHDTDALASLADLATVAWYAMPEIHTTITDLTSEMESLAMPSQIRMGIEAFLTTRNLITSVSAA